MTRFMISRLYCHEINTCGIKIERLSTPFIVSLLTSYQQAFPKWQCFNHSAIVSPWVFLLIFNCKRVCNVGIITHRLLVLYKKNTTRPPKPDPRPPKPDPDPRPPKPDPRPPTPDPQNPTLTPDPRLPNNSASFVHDNIFREYPPRYSHVNLNYELS